MPQPVVHGGILVSVVGDQHTQRLPLYLTQSVQGIVGRRRYHHHHSRLSFFQSSGSRLPPSLVQCTDYSVRSGSASNRALAGSSRIICGSPNVPATHS